MSIATISVLAGSPVPSIAWPTANSPLAVAKAVSRLEPLVRVAVPVAAERLAVAVLCEGTAVAAVSLAPLHPEASKAAWVVYWTWKLVASPLGSIQALIRAAPELI